MAAANYTPIALYHSTTASAAPTSGNLVNGELAINITDGKLYYKDNGGTVQVIASKGTGTIGGSTTQVQYNSSGALAGSSNFTFDGTIATINTLNLTNALGATYGGTAQSSWTTGDLLYASASNTLAKLGVGLNTYILTSNGTIPGWAAPSAISVNTATNLAGGAAGSVPYQSGAGATTFLSIGTANQVVTSTGSAPQWSSGLSITTLTASDAVTFSATTQNIALGTSQTSGTFTVGGTAQTGNLVFDRSTKTHTLNVAAGITESGQTKTINIGTAGDTGSTTAIAIGSTNGTTITLNGTVNATTVNVTTLDLTNLEVTNIKAKDGTASMSIADSTGVVSITANPVLSGGTANGVTYLNGSKVLTSGSALTFDGTNLYMGATIGAKLALYQSGGSNIYGFGVESGAITFLTSSSEQARLTSSGLEIKQSQLIGYSSYAGIGSNGLAVAGNVGIGTASPLARLTVSDSTVTNGTMTLGNNASYNGTLQYIFSTGELRISQVGGSSLGTTFYTNGNERLRITSTGTLNIVGAGTAGSTQAVSFNGAAPVDSLVLTSGGSVGIGTSSPSQKLSVATASGNAYIEVARASKSTGQVALQLTGGTSGTNWIVYQPTNSDNLTFFGNSADRMVIDSSGNVGIGTTSPSSYGQVAVLSGGTPTLSYLSVLNGGVAYASPFESTLYIGSARTDSVDNGKIAGYRLKTYSADSNGAYFSFEAASRATGSSSPPNVFTERLRIDSSGNLFLKQGYFSLNNNGYIRADVTNQLCFQSGSSGTVFRKSDNSTDYMTLDASGNLLVGTTSVLGAAANRGNVTINGSTDSILSFGNAGSLAGYILQDSGGTTFFSSGATYQRFYTNSTERARITSGGYFKASNDGTYYGSTGTYHELRNTANSEILYGTNTNANPFGVTLNYTAATPNGTGNSFLQCVDSTATRAVIRSNGGLANYQANDVNLSDQRTKKDIVAAPSYWDKIKSIEIVHFKYKDQTHEDNNVGVIAQQVEQVAPEFVDQDGWGETPEDGVPLKSIYTSDMYHAAIKALQEAMARIEQLEAKVAALSN
jgi:hypothetical protein